MRGLSFVLHVMLMTVVLASAAHAERLALVAGGDRPIEGLLPAVQAKLDGPFGVDFDRAGNMYIVEISGHRVLKVDPSGTLVRIGGTGDKSFGGDGGPAINAHFDGMHSLVITPDDSIYIADTWNCRVRQIDPKTGVIATVAGTGEKAYGGDGGPASDAKLAGIYCIAYDRAKDRLILTDLHNRRIRAVNRRSGVITTIAGNGEKGVPEDGAIAVDAPLFDPRAAAVDSKGNLYILERSGHALRVVDPSGRIRTVAGTGKKGATGDGGPALKATMNGPKHICIDAQDRVVIADAENHLIRRYDPVTGLIERIAGTGEKGTAGVGGDPLKVQLNRPHGVAFDAAGTLYITDSHNDRVLKIVP